MIALNNMAKLLCLLPLTEETDLPTIGILKFMHFLESLIGCILYNSLDSLHI